VSLVVRCDGTGSVGSSGDTTIGSNNGNDDNGTGTGTNGNTPLPPLTNCDTCLADTTLITTAQLSALAVSLGLAADATVAQICVQLDTLTTVGALVSVLDEAGLTANAILSLLSCLGIDISLTEIIAIIGVV
jgi:hypothetical protein